VSRTAAVVLAFVALILFAIPSSAQLLPNGNVYAGVSYGQFENAGVNRQSYHGWNAAAEDFPFARFTHLSFVLDTSGFYRKGVCRLDSVCDSVFSTASSEWKCLRRCFLWPV
jgi:hypothetical protein